MVDILQFAVFFIIVILTVLVVVLGIQVFFILKDLRQTLSKANRVLDDTAVITEAISRPVGALSAFTTSIKAGSTLVKLFNKLLSTTDRKEKNGEKI